MGSDPIYAGAGTARMIQLGDLIVILDLYQQGLSISAIARRTGRDPKTIRKYIERGLEPPAESEPRQMHELTSLLIDVFDAPVAPAAE